MWKSKWIALSFIAVAGALILVAPRAASAAIPDQADHDPIIGATRCPVCDGNEPVYQSELDAGPLGGTVTIGPVSAIIQYGGTTGRYQDINWAEEASPLLAPGPDQAVRLGPQ